ncbi:MAG TPA: pitrilysin family protein [Candidatus Kapabacteria bacterium]|nr:pitrilysin family protein [Candidatus Kapabacteria bacterium]
MKKIILFLLIITSYYMSAQDINLDTRPEPLSDIKYPFPKHDVEELKNGIKVFLIEDKEQPTIAIRIMIGGGSSLDGDKSGLSELTSGLLTKGTKNFTAEQIANKLDGVGASISANSNADYITIYAQSLKKHQKLLFDMLSEVLLKANFPQDEFEKLQKQMIAGIQYEKSNPSNLAQQLARIALYGKNYPYAKVNSEQTISSIKLEDIKNYYNNWFVANNVTIAVIGDFNKKKITSDLQAMFGKWAKRDSMPKITMPEPETMPKGVYFIGRPGSVQSSVVVTTLTVPYLSKSYETLNLAANILGSFSGRLFSTLREKYSFTYTPFGFQTRTKFTNRFAAGADVTAAKTDSSIQVILDELKGLTETAPDVNELNRIRQYTLGGYLMSLESASYLASLIQNTDFYGGQIAELENYPDRLKSMTPNDMKDVARNYINPDKAIIVVVGSPNVRESLTQFGQVFDYDMDLKTQDGPNATLEKIKMNAEELIENYVDAIGGEDKINGIKTLAIKGSSDMSISGQIMTGEVSIIKTNEGRMYQKSDFRLFSNESWVNNGDAYLKLDGNLIKMEDKDKGDLLLESYPIALLKLNELQMKAEVLGKNSKYIVLQVTDKANKVEQFYFDKDTYLLAKKEILAQSADGNELIVIKYDNYQEYAGVKFPNTVISQSSSMNITNKYIYEVNSVIDENLLNPNK